MSGLGVDLDAFREILGAAFPGCAIRIERNNGPMRCIVEWPGGGACLVPHAERYTVWLNTEPAGRPLVSGLTTADSLRLLREIPGVQRASLPGRALEYVLSIGAGGGPAYCAISLALGHVSRADIPPGGLVPKSMREIDDWFRLEEDLPEIAAQSDLFADADPHYREFLSRKEELRALRDRYFDSEKRVQSWRALQDLSSLVEKILSRKPVVEGSVSPHRQDMLPERGCRSG